MDSGAGAGQLREKWSVASGLRRSIFGELLELLKIENGKSYKNRGQKMEKVVKIVCDFWKKL